MATTAVGTITHDTTVAIMAVVIIQATTTGPTTGLCPAFTSAGAMVGGGIVAGMAAVGTTMVGTGAVDGIITTESGPSDRQAPKVPYQVASLRVEPTKQTPEMVARISEAISMGLTDQCCKIL